MLAVAPREPTIQQDAPQETYKSKKPEEGDQQRGPTLEKKQRGANILEVKYQKVTYRRYFTKVKYKKVIYRR